MNRRFICLITIISHEHFPLIDCWSVTTKDETKMPIQRKVVTPIVKEKLSPFDRHTLPTRIKTKKDLTRSSIIKWDHVPRQSILIPPTVNNDCSGISPFFSVFKWSDEENHRQMDDKFNYWNLQHQKRLIFWF